MSKFAKKQMKNGEGEMKIAVAGTGYVGLVTGVCLASKGHDVTCVDIDKKRWRSCKRETLPFMSQGCRN